MNLSQKKNYIVAITVFLLSPFLYIVEAADSRLSQLFGTFYNFAYPIVIFYGIFQIIYAGYRIMKSEGEPNTLNDAKKHLTDSIIGIIFVILAIVILKLVVKNFLSIDI
jgi:hypothetical protein